MKDLNNGMKIRAHFAIEQNCIDFLIMARWGNTIICPHCRHDKVYKFSDGKRFKCAACRKIFNPKTGLFMENTKLPLSKWIIAMHYNVNHSKGISSYQLAREIGVQQKTALFMLNRIRKNIADGIFRKPLGAYEGVVEIDETFVGGKNKNRHWDKKVKNSQGRSYKDKTPVLGMLERGGKLIVVKVPDTKRSTVHPIVKRNVISGSTIMTDEWKAYEMLYRTYDHSFVNHGARQYVNGNAHTNSIEGFWSLFKRSIIGIYHWVSGKYVHLYACEAAYRYNTRKMKPISRIFMLLHHANGKVTKEDVLAMAA